MTRLLLKALLDTNILLRMTELDSPARPLVLKALDALIQSSYELFVTPQCLIEFWAVLTRPKENNGLGMTVQEAVDRVQGYLSLYSLAEDTAEVFPEWRRLVERYGVSGKQAHDARLVAVMKAHGITHMLTFDTEDFRRYADTGLTFLHPNEMTE